MNYVLLSVPVQHAVIARPGLHQRRIGRFIQQIGDLPPSQILRFVFLVAGLLIPLDDESRPHAIGGGREVPEL